MHRSRLAAFVIDCKVDDIDTAATFWSRALGRTVVPPTPESGDYRELTASKNEPMLLLQKVTHDSRIHLDIETDDVDAEVLRLKKLGATEVERIRTWVVMEAPSGQRFCVVRPQREDFPGNATEWPD